MKVAVCAIAKKENLYIREWVEWYKNLGVSKIFLYDHNDVDGERFEDVINDYIESGFVEIIDVRGQETSYVNVNRHNEAMRSSIQHKCYLDCYTNKVSEFDWVFFCDVDEFLKFKSDYTLETFLGLETFKDTDTIMVPWVIYDDNDLVHYDDRPVVERFTHISENQWYLVKSFARTNKEMCDENMRHIIHTFRLVGNKIKCADGSDFTDIDDEDNLYELSDSIVKNCMCVVNHYKTKTIEEYMEKRYKRVWTQDGFHAYPVLESFYRTIKDFFIYCKKTDEKMDCIDKFKIKNNISEEDVYKGGDFLTHMRSMNSNL